LAEGNLPGSFSSGRRTSSSIASQEEVESLFNSRLLNPISLKFKEPELENEYLEFLEENTSYTDWKRFLIVYGVVGFVYCAGYVLIRIFVKFPYGRHLLSSFDRIRNIILLVIFGWTLPIMILVKCLELSKAQRQLKSFPKMAVLFNCIATGVGVLGQYYVEHEYEGGMNPEHTHPTEPFMFYFLAIFTFHLFNYIPFVTCLISNILLIGNFLVLSSVNKFYLTDSFVLIIFQFLISFFSLTIMSYQKERLNREQFFNVRAMNCMLVEPATEQTEESTMPTDSVHINIVNEQPSTPVNSFKNSLTVPGSPYAPLSSSYLSRSSFSGSIMNQSIKSPIEKVFNLIRSLLMNSNNISSNQMKVLLDIVHLLNSSNLFTPDDLHNQIKKGFVKLDNQQKKWLFTEIMLLKNRDNEETEDTSEVHSLNEVNYDQQRRRSVPYFSDDTFQDDSFCSDDTLDYVFKIIDCKNTSSNENSPTKSTISLVDDEIQTAIPTDHVANCLVKVDQWDFPIFELNECTSNHALFTLSIYLFKRYNLFEKLNIPLDIFSKCILALECGYRKDIPYHTSLHAADVLQATHYFCSQSNVKYHVSNLDLLSLLYAAIVHDYDHPGMNNNFLISTLEERAVLYNDKSVLENHHLAASFKQFFKYNFLKGLDRKEFQEFRETVIDLVLATDLSKHFEILTLFKTKIEKKEDKDALGTLFRDTSCSGTLNEFNPEKNRSDKLLLFQIVIKCSDVCNSSKPFHLHQKWVNLVLQEFFHQGDKEKALNLPISPLMDRDNVNLASSQSGFIEFLCFPLYSAFHRYANVPFVIQTLELNRKYWSRKQEREKEHKKLKQ
jgi:hypothetical protein